MFNHHLENTLANAIQKKELAKVNTLINWINEEAEARLLSLNNDSHSFLHLALHYGATDEFKSLYEEIKSKEGAKALMSRLDNEGNSLFALAIRLGDSKAIKSRHQKRGSQFG